MNSQFKPGQPFKTFVLDTQAEGDDRIGPYSVAYIGQPYVRATSEVAEFLLIGEAYHLEAGGMVELESFVAELTDGREIMQHFAKLCGHFVLFFWLKAEQELVGMTDAGAQMTFYYLGDGHRIAGQVRELLCHGTQRSWDEDDQLKASSLFGRTMPWPNVFRVMPNHALVCPPGAAKEMRYYPMGPLKTHSEEHVVEQSIRHLKRAIASLPQESTLMFSITGGLDSRACLAGISEEQRHRSQYYVRNIPTIQSDAVIAQIIAKHLDLPLHLLEPDSPVISDLSESYMQQGFDHPSFGPKIMKFPSISAPTFIFGNVAEAFKTNFARVNSTNARKWLTELGAPHSANLQADMEAWIEETASLPEGWHRSDLLYWEWRLPNFLQPFVFRRLASEDRYFTPYANRGLIELMLGLPPRKRLNNFHVGLQAIGLKALGGKRIAYNPDPKSRLLYLAQRFGLYLPYRFIRFYLR